MNLEKYTLNKVIAWRICRTHSCQWCLDSWTIFCYATHAWEYPPMILILYSYSWLEKDNNKWSFPLFLNKKLKDWCSLDFLEVFATLNSAFAPHWQHILLSFHTEPYYDPHPLTARLIWIADYLCVSICLPHCWSSAVALEYYHPEGRHNKRGSALCRRLSSGGPFLLQVDGPSGGKAIHLYHLIHRTHY